MSYGATTLVSCQTLQDRLTNYFETCGSASKRDESSFFNFLLSAENRTGLNTRINPGQGRTRTLELTYFQRILESAVSANQANPNCVATTPRGNCSTTYEMDTDDNLQINELITLNDWATICESNEFLLETKVMAMIDALMARASTKTADELPALLGEWGGNQPLGAGAGGNARIDVRTTRTGAADEVFPWTAQDINNALRQSAYCDNSVVFGGQTLGTYYERLESGCCSDSGLDLGDLFQRFRNVFSWDYRVSEAISGNTNGNENAAIQRGALQLLVYAANQLQDGVRDFYGEGTSQRLGVITDPVTGAPMDLMVKHDCGAIHITLTFTSLLVGLPSDLYGTGDRYDGVNYAQQIRVDNT